MLSIVVLISGNGSNLQAILDQTLTGGIQGQIKAVFSNRQEAYGLTRAAKADIPTVVLSHKEYDSRESYDEALQNAIDQFAPDLIVLAGFMRILTADFVNHYQGKMINIHPSLLPKYKGLNTFQRAIDNHEKEHGASVHFVTPDLDGGPVIAQIKTLIDSDDTVESLTQKVQIQERVLYPQVVKWFAEGKLVLKEGKVSYAGQPIEEHGVQI